jgi:hypothetical protein
MVDIAVLHEIMTESFTALRLANVDTTDIEKRYFAAHRALHQIAETHNGQEVNGQVEVSDPDFQKNLDVLNDCTLKVRALMISQAGITKH